MDKERKSNIVIEIATKLIVGLTFEETYLQQSKGKKN